MDLQFESSINFPFLEPFGLAVKQIPINWILTINTHMSEFVASDPCLHGISPSLHSAAKKNQSGTTITSFFLLVKRIVPLFSAVDTSVVDDSTSSPLIIKPSLTLRKLVSFKYACFALPTVGTLTGRVVQFANITIIITMLCLYGAISLQPNSALQ